MFVLRCTRRLLRDVRGLVPEAPAHASSETVLGDWYATRLNIAQRRYILAVNAPSLLALVVTARDPAALPERIVAAAEILLTNIGVPRRARERELRLMSTAFIAPTRDRSVLSSMTDIGWLAWDELYDLPHRPGRTLDHINVILAGTAVRARDYRAPRDIALEMLR